MLKKIILVCLFTLICLFNLSAYADKTPNLVKNSGFEEGSNTKSVNWINFGGLRQGATFSIVDFDHHSGGNCLLISNTKDSDTMVMQQIKVEKGKIYKVNCWIKTEDIKNQPGSANVSLFYVSNGVGSKGIYTSKEFMNTGDKWKKLEFFIKTRGDIDDPLNLALRLGGQGIANKGKAYFDDVELAVVEQPGEGDYFVFKEESNSNITDTAAVDTISTMSQNSSKQSNDTMKYIYYAIGVTIAMICIVILEYLVRKNGKKH